MNSGTSGARRKNGTQCLECISPTPPVGSQLSLWISPNTGSAKQPSVSLPVSQMTTLRADGDCKQCGGEQAFYIQPIIGMLVEWCGKCRKETVVERRRMPRE
jgi:hypothetical protein